MDIELRDIPEFPNYKVGSDGTIWTAHMRGRVPKGTAQSIGGQWLYPISQCRLPIVRDPTQHYLYVRIKHESGEYKNRLAHRLVLEAFVGPCPQGMECRHFPDSTPSNNNLCNLSWGTPVENAADRKVHGTDFCDHGNRIRGERQWKAKLTAELVRAIRLDHATNPSHGWQTRLSKKYGVCCPVIAGVVRRTMWKHVE